MCCYSVVVQRSRITSYNVCYTKLLRADTLKTVPDTIPNEKIIQAYFNVKFFRQDLQGKCDSLVYYSKDSTLCLFHDPILWSGDNQMTSDYMEMVRNNFV